MGTSASVGSSDGVVADDIPLEDKLTWLKRSECLAGISDALLTQLAQHTQVTSYSNGAQLSKQGAAHSKFGIVISGMVDVQEVHFLDPDYEGVVDTNGPDIAAPPGAKMDLNKRCGSIQIGSKENQGFSFGETALVARDQVTLQSIVARTPVKLLTMTSEFTDQLNTVSSGLPNEPELLDAISKGLTMCDKPDLTQVPFFAEIVRMMKDDGRDVMGVLEVLGGLFSYEGVGKRNVVFSAGSHGDKFYIVAGGCIKIHAENCQGSSTTLNMLTKNEVFGEIAILQDTTRTATATAFEPSLLLTTTRAKFEQFLGKTPFFQEYMERAIVHYRTGNSLTLVKFFSELLDAPARIEVGALMTFRDYASGAVVCTEGSEAHEIYVLLSGEVIISCNSKVLSVLGGGSVLGEMAVLTSSRRTCTIETTMPSQVLILGHENFKRFSEAVPLTLMDRFVQLAHSRRESDLASKHGPKNSPTIPSVDDVVKAFADADPSNTPEMVNQPLAQRRQSISQAKEGRRNSTAARRGSVTAGGNGGTMAARAKRAPQRLSSTDEGHGNEEEKEEVADGLGLSTAEMKALEQHHRSSMRIQPTDSDSDTDSDEEGVEK